MFKLQGLNYKPSAPTIRTITLYQLFVILQKVAARNLSNESSTQNVFEGNLTESETSQIEEILERYFEERHESERSEWTMMNSVFFASTVVTTIGEFIFKFCFSSFLYLLKLLNGTVKSCLKETKIWQVRQERRQLEKL